MNNDEYYIVMGLFSKWFKKTAHECEDMMDEQSDFFECAYLEYGYRKRN